MWHRGGSRRGFLKGLGLAAAGGLVALPSVGRVLADPGPMARARRVLGLNLLGGIRSSAAFHAGASTRYNPWGLMEGTGTPFALGRVLDDTPPGEAPLPDSAYTLGAAWGGARLPRLREVGGAFSVLGTWSMVRGDHERARIEESTGSATGADPGLLTRIAAGLGEGAGGELAMPTFHVAPFARFGSAPAALTRYAPVSLASADSLPRAAGADTMAEALTGRAFLPEVGLGWIDDAIARRRAGRARLVTDTLALHRRAARGIGARLAMPDIAVADDGEQATMAALGTVRVGAADVRLTNAMLREAMEKCVTDDPTGELLTTARNAALAVRLLQLGSPAVVLEIADFDFHSGERAGAPRLYAFLGRLWATLSWLLPRIPDPSGEGSLLDRTLVTTFSDFGRDGHDGGFNSGEGSDHGLDASCFYLAHPIMGAGVPGGRLVGAASTTTFDARDEDLQISPQRFMATILGSIGLDPAREGWGFPEAGGPVEELWS